MVLIDRALWRQLDQYWLLLPEQETLQLVPTEKVMLALYSATDIESPDQAG